MTPSRRGVLAGAGALLASRAVRADTPAAITWWYVGAPPADQATLDQLFIQPFNASQGRWRLQVEYRGDALPDQLKVALAAGEGPDLVMSNGPGYMQPMAAAGQIMPLDDYARKFGWNDKIIPVFSASNIFNGKLYGIPKRYETQVLFYNKTLFDKHGWTPPKNIDELTIVANAMLAQRIQPIAWGNAGARFVNHHVLSVVFNLYAGADNVHAALSGTMPWNAPVFVDSVKLLKTWWDAGWLGGTRYFSVANDQSFALMAAGRAGMAMQGTWAFGWIGGTFGNTGQQCAWAPLPTLSSIAKYPTYPIGIGNNLSINTHSPNPDGAAAVIEFLLQPEMVRKLSAALPGLWNIPLTALVKQDATADLSKESGERQVVAETARAATTGNYGYVPWSYWPARTDDYLKSGIEEVWLGKATPQQFCDKCQELFAQDQKDGRLIPIPPRSTT